MEKRGEKALGLAAALLVVGIVVDIILTERTNMRVLPAVFPYLILALGVCLLVFARELLARLAEG